MMRITFILMLSVFLTILSCSPDRRKDMQTDNAININFRDKTVRKIVCYGSSLTAIGNWVNQVKDVLADKYPGAAAVINRGRIAAASDWGIENFEKLVIKENPDIVFLEFSINDAYLPYDISPETSRSNLIYMIDRLTEHNPECILILMTMNHPLNSHLADRPEIALYYQIYRETAAEKKIPLIDFYPVWLQSLEDDPEKYRSFFPDGIHTSFSGCSEIITPEILRILGVSEK